MAKKIYFLKHVQSGRCFTVTASSFDEAVRRTFDENLLNWKCESVEELKLEALCKLCEYPIDPEDSIVVQEEGDVAGEEVHRCCPVCVDCGDYLGDARERHASNASTPSWNMGFHYCLKDAFKHGLIDNAPLTAPVVPETHPAEKRLKEWTEVMDQMAHDLKGALTFLGLYIDMFSETKAEFAAKEKDCRKTAKESYDKIVELIASIRDYARASQLRYKANDFVDVVKKTIAELSAQAARQNVILHYAGPEYLVGIFDSEKVGRILTNLCVNALQAIEKPSGSIFISVLHNEHAVWIDVTDTGKGIAEEHLHKVFLKKFTHGKKGGTGLGLSFCKQIVEAHGGSIGVSSRPGEGTTFSLVFPLSAVLLAEKIVYPLSRKEVLRAFLLDDECPQWEVWMQTWHEKYGEENISLMDAQDCLPSGFGAEVTLDPNKFS
ncbi:MAG: HAMP domain-containing histidine kinase [Deltaproteobacteria bacterium]|nr:HAMP domain-containing histidine kinase [Deltaproteobacteria bacterium]